jgi:hypothetical protein
VRYSFDPIDTHRGDTELSVIAERVGKAKVTVEGWRRTGLNEANADACATALGLHPWQLWPEMLAANTAPVVRECETCGETFVLTDPRKRFCNRRCKDAHPSARAHRSAKAAEAFRQRYHSDPEFRAARLAQNAEERRRMGPERWNAYKRKLYARKRATA